MRLEVLSAFSMKRVLYYASFTFDLQRAIPSARVHVTTLSLLRKYDEYRNLNRLSISLTLRLSLRPRLTLIRLSLTRNPWSSGEEVSRLLYRYLCLHLPFRPLQRVSRRAFGGNAMLPYQHSLSRGFGNALIPVHHPCGTARPVSCYALFECMAASKPTS